MREPPEQVSSCCSAAMLLCQGGGDSRAATLWFECSACKQPCDALPATEEQGK